MARSSLPPSSQHGSCSQLRQSKLNFRARSRPGHVQISTASSAVTVMLSQHEIFVMLCSYLSSADIIHLGATSREHWQYVS